MEREGERESERERENDGCRTKQLAIVETVYSALLHRLVVQTNGCHYDSVETACL